MIHFDKISKTILDFLSSESDKSSKRLAGFYAVFIATIGFFIHNPNYTDWLIFATACFAGTLLEKRNLK